MKRERMAWLVSVILLAILAFQLPGTMAQRDDDYAWVRTLVQVHRLVDNNYVDPVDDEKLKIKSIESMLSELDPFTNYIPPERQEDFDRMLDGTFKGVGITLDEQQGKVTVVTPIEGSPADLAGMKAGDVIVKVNGESVEGMHIADVVKKVAGPIDTQVTLTVQRDGGKEVSFTMKRQEIVLPTVKGYDRNKDDSWNYFVCDNPKIGYVRITQFDKDTFDELKRAMLGTSPAPGQPGQPGIMDLGMKGLIVDLRFNPGGRLEQAIRVVNMFVKKDSVIVTTRGRNRPEQIEKATGDGMLPYFPMIVLVNEHSASAAEIVSGSLKDNKRALIIGQRTYGKGSVQEVMPLDANSGELKLTVAYYYLPSGRLVHKKKDATDWGVEPQIIVPVDDAGEMAIHQLFEEQETIRRPSGYRPATQPSTQPTDPQMQQALNTMIGLVVLDNGQQGPSTPVIPPAAPTIPTTQPTTQPSTQP